MLRKLFVSPLTLSNFRSISFSISLSEGLSFTFASPGQVFYTESSVRQIDVPSISGNFGIVEQHVPTLSCLKPGIVVVTEDDGSLKKYFVSSGSVSVNEDSSVQILAEEAVTIDMLDHNAVREGLGKAQQEVSSASSEEAKAEAQIAMECWEALNKAIDEK